VPAVVERRAGDLAVSGAVIDDQDGGHCQLPGFVPGPVSAPVSGPVSGPVAANGGVLPLYSEALRRGNQRLMTSWEQREHDRRTSTSAWDSS
jgi:hypothetical protein